MKFSKEAIYIYIALIEFKTHVGMMAHIRMVHHITITIWST